MKTTLTLLLFLLTFCFVNAQNTVPGLPSGHTNGEFNVTDAGAAMYDIPLIFTPGSAGVQPSVSLTYSSQSGNGLLGLGWTIQGLSVITRASQTIAQDGEIKSISFTSDDRFALDGERLILVDSTNAYGGNGVEYRTEQNAFHKVVSYGAGNTPTHFKVFTNSGLIMEYGSTDNTRVSVGGSQSPIAFWMLDKVTDTKGNYYTISYYRNHSHGEYYPLEIKYTGNSNNNKQPYAKVVFEYENRLDTTIQFHNDKKIVSNARRLKSIKNYYNATLVRSYSFTYQYTSGNFSQLISVKECGINSICHEPTTFTYSNADTPSFALTSFNVLPANIPSDELLSIDINADGVQDILRISKGNNVKAYTGNKTPGNLTYKELTFYSGVYVADKYSIADFNGDGKPDILTYSSSSGGNTLFMNQTSSTDTQIIAQGIGGAFPSTLFANNRKIVTQDFNGDGRSDILSYDSSTGYNNWMFSDAKSNSSISFIKISNDSNFVNIFTGNELKQQQVSFADFNGDGLLDVFTINPYNGENWLYYNEGNIKTYYPNGRINVITPSLLTSNAIQLKIADFNGDNIPDFILYNNNTGETTWMRSSGSTGYKTMQAQPSSLKNEIKNADELILTDINADGINDLVYIHKATGTNKWFINDGKLNFTQLNNNLIPKNDMAYDFFSIGNFTSKADFDFFIYKNASSPRTRVAKCGQKYNNLLTKITAGNGQEFDIEYDFLTSDSLYDKGDGALYPFLDYQATQFVVKNYKIDNGVGGKNQISYHYSGAKLNLQGRGFRGFSRIDTKDENTGIIQSNFYSSDSNSWKYINSPLVQSETRLPGNVLVSKTTIENGLKTFYGGRCHFSYVKKNTSKTYELNGNFVDSTVTTYDYDDYGNVTNTLTDFGGGHKDSLVSTFNNNPNNWILSRLRYSKLYRYAPGKPTIVKSSGFNYDSTNGTGLLLDEITEPDSGNTVRIKKSYQHDSYGNITQSSVAAWNGSAVEVRTTSSTMDSLGRFVITATNAIGQVSENTYEPYLGKVVEEKDINNLTTTHSYDGMGRLMKTVYPDGNWIKVDYRKCSSSFSCPTNATHLVYTQFSTGPPVIKYYDILDREVRTERIGFNGKSIYKDIVYDSVGNIIKESKPYFSTDTPIYTYYQYDIIGRKTVITEPGNRVDSVIYEGRKTNYINALGQKKILTNDPREKLIISEDNQGSKIRYEYDAAGRGTKITDPKGNTVFMKYDIHGNKIEQQDPDMGTFKYTTNGFGELIKQVDPKNNIVTLEYDSLSRLIIRTEPEGVTKWQYDTQPNGNGLLDSVVSYNYYKAAYTYDSFGRVKTYEQRIDSQTYIQSYTYDSLGRLDTTIYPSGFGTRNLYNAFGYLRQVRNANSNAVYWTANVLNAKDEIEQQTYGNGTEVNKTYDSQTDFLTAINTKKGNVYLQNMSYTYNVLGTLEQRKDILQNKQEDFQYDDLNRLIKSQVVGQDSIIINYDTLGNITFKSDVGTYNYGGINAGPHQVKSITLTTNQCVPSLLINHAFNSHNKVSQITKDSFTVNINYNPDRLRNLQKMYVNNQLRRTKVYVSGLFEKEIRKGDTIETHYVRAGGAVIATYTTHSQNNKQALQYLHRDHLGSTTLVTDDTAKVIGRYSFDAWGKRRNADWSGILTDTTGLIADRGFTGHEHYDLFNLVDMNGRIYDPVIGRFTSPDPYIQDPTNLQSLNRYSYVLNNPLSYTDPSGFFFKKIFRAIKKVFKAIGRAVKKVVQAVKENWRSIATIAVTIVVGTLTAGSGIIFSGAATGFASNTTSTLLSGGNFGDALKAGFRGAVIGAATARLTYGIGEKWGHKTTTENVFQKSIAHGVVQGGATKARGGKFIHGFISGAATSGASLYTDNINNYAGSVAASAIVGGTVSEVTGGSFANGAVTGAFISMFNAHGKEHEKNEYENGPLSKTQAEMARYSLIAKGITSLHPASRFYSLASNIFFGQEVLFTGAGLVKNAGWGEYSDGAITPIRAGALGLATLAVMRGGVYGFVLGGSFIIYDSVTPGGALKKWGIEDKLNNWNK